MPRSSDVEESARAVSSSDPDTLANSRSISQSEADNHAARMEEHRSRLLSFNEECRHLVSYLGKSNMLRKIGSTVALAEYEYKLGESAEYGIISQSNLPGFSTLLHATLSAKRNILAHTIELSDLRADYSQLLCKEGLKILRYFTSNTSVISSSQGSIKKSNYFLRIMDIFLVDSGQQVLVMHERFNVDLSMQHKLWNGKWCGTYRTYNVKQWAIQVAEAVEILNLAGVVHRFVRPENILLIPHRNGHTTIKLTSFDFACRYWDAESRTSIGLAPKLPLDLESHLLNHLPPESFTEGYDGSMVDVWSIGTLICLLMTDEIPFEVPEEVTTGSSTTLFVQSAREIAPVDYIQKWRRCEQRRMLPDEMRSMLDDIFREADSRICAWEVAKDQRLLCKTNRELNKMRLPAYYRIDLTKNVNLEGPDLIRSTKAQIVPMAESSFAPESKDIFTMTSYQILREGGEAAITEYRVLREASFGENLSSSVIINDYYLKASRAGQTEADFLVKIVPMFHIPSRHRNMLLNEGSKIMRYMSDTSPIKSHIHRVLDMFLLSETYFYIFFENLDQHLSIYHAVLPPLSNSSCTRKFPPSLHSTDSLLSLANIQAWVHALAQTVDSMSKLGLAHRYIRPEYVFVSKNEPSKIKLSHFDLASFVWNPIKFFLVRRTRGIQDEKEHLWNHLPPECYDPLYDCLQVDVWSVAVLLAFCLTGKMPFTTPLTMSQATSQWSEFKRTNSSVLKTQLLVPSTELLDLIFVSEERRLKVAQLVDKSVASKLIPRQRPRSSDGATRTNKSCISSGSRNSRGK